MSKILAVVTQKGGVGKTTTTNALAAGYRKKGFKVLAVDMDPQRNLTFSMGTTDENCASVYHVLKSEVKAQFAIQRTVVSDLIPSSPLLSGIELEFTGKNRQFLLRQSLEPIVDQYDYILIDCPPGLGILTANALVFAQHVLVPTLSDVYSLQGLVQLYETISYVRESSNPSISITGVLLNRYNPRLRLAKELLGTAEMICQSLDIPLLDTKIRNCITLTEAQNLQCNLIEYGPRSRAAQDYLALVEELLERGV